MWNKIKGFPIVAQISFAKFVHDFKKDERGLSGVVVTVLLILVAVLAVTAIWGLLDGWIADLWDRITTGSDGIS